MRLLPAERRRAIYAVYGFCRTIDDIADGPGAETEKLATLEVWREEVGRLYRGAPGHPAAAALTQPVARYGLAEDDFLAVIDGMEMDASGRMLAPSLDDLDLYCARAACAVGRLSVRIFGLHEEMGQPLAFSLGRALQLTNILRDLAEDAARGRLYLPLEILDGHGIGARDPDTVLSHPAVAAVCAEVSARAQVEFAAARQVLTRAPRGPGRPARIMCRVYEQLLARLGGRGFEPHSIAQPVRFGCLEKMGIALGVWWGDMAGAARD